MESERALVLRSTGLPLGTYAFILELAPGGSTRLLVRDRAAWPWWQRPFRRLLYEPLHSCMQTGQLQGLKARAERHAGATDAAARRARD